MHRNTLLSAATLAGMLVATQAQAGGFYVARFGGEHGHPTTDNLTAMYYNPAGLSLKSGTRFMIDGTIAYRSFDYTRDPGGIDTVLDKPNDPDAPKVGAGTPAEAVELNSGKASLRNVVAAPFIGAASDFGIKNFSAGLSMYVPFGGTSEWDQTEANADYPGAKDGPQRWWIMEGMIRSIYYTAAASYRLADIGLSFGGGVNFVHSEIDTSRARNSSGLDDMTSGGKIQEGRAILEADVWDVAVSAGVIYQPNDQWWLGLSYQSQPGFGENTLVGSTDMVVGGGPIDPNNLTTPIEMKQELPDIIHFGARWQPSEKWEARLFGNYQRWSVHTEQCVLNSDVENRDCATGDGSITTIPRYWDDAIALRGGGSYFMSPDLELFGGLGYNQSAVPDETVEASLYDSESYSLSLGARVELLDDALALEASFTQLFYADRETAPRDRMVDSGGRDISALPAGQDDPRVRLPDPAGLYEQSISVVNLSVSYAF